MAEVKSHPWYNGPVATIEYIQQEFALRKARIDQENEAKRIAKEQEKATRVAAGGFVAARRQYRRGVNRGKGEEGEEENKYSLEETKREMEEYVRIINKNTEFFSTADPNQLLDELAGYF